MTDHKKKGDFDKGGKDDVGGNKKQDNKSENSRGDRTGENSGTGGRG